MYWKQIGRGPEQNPRDSKVQSFQKSSEFQALWNELHRLKVSLVVWVNN